MIKPLNNNLIITPLESEEKTKSGIYIPKTANEQEVKRGKVVEVADDILDIGIGDIVLYKKYSPDIMLIDDIEYLTLKYEDVLALTEESKERVEIRQDFEKDTLQPDNPKFKKAYPNAPKL